MARRRVYATIAERQAAYRQRQGERLRALEAGIAVKPARKTPRPLARPARLQRAIDELAALASEYEEWVQNLPENQADSTQAEKGNAIVDLLHDVLDTLADADPPKGFGRD